MNTKKTAIHSIATVVDIRQCTAIPVPLVIELKIVQWRSERGGRCKVTSIKPN